ncbi:MAG: hypothetical protein WC096_00470 [Sphaerochaetaceae bacterium]
MTDCTSLSIEDCISALREDTVTDGSTLYIIYEREERIASIQVLPDHLIEVTVSSGGWQDIHVYADDIAISDFGVITLYQGEKKVSCIPLLWKDRMEIVRCSNPRGVSA